MYARWDEDIEYWGPIWNQNLLGAVADDGEDGTADLPQTVFTHEDGMNSPNLVFDTEGKILYYNNMLIAVLAHDVPDEIKIEVAKSVSGSIVGQIDGAFQLLQIMISNSNHSAISDLCAKLMQNENVLYATYDTYLEAEMPCIDNNPWSTSGVIPDKGNESNPSENDWWAEAIGAYTAWRYSDYAEEVVIGQIDSGFDLNHEELVGKITLLDGYETNNIFEEDDNGELNIQNHGTMVAGISVAKNNDVGLRGVADFARIVGIDDSPELAGTFNSVQFMDAISEMLLNGIKIINLEIYSPPFSEKTYKEKLAEYGIEDEFNSYDEYLESHLRNAYYTAKLIMAAMCTAKNNGYSDFLLIQAAGNGYNNWGTVGNDAKYSGYFASINQESYGQFVELRLTSANSTLIPDYSFFDERIIIVGGVENRRDSDGNYYIRGLNYGADVDICACSYNIYSSNAYNTYKLRYGGGTSSAAPMVAGAVAFIWGLNPELSAPIVKHIVCENYKYKAIGAKESEGWEYPFLNVGLAVETVFNELYPNNVILTGKIKDKSSNKEISDVWVTYCNEDDEIIYRTRTDDLGTINDVIVSDLSKFIVHLDHQGYRSITLSNMQKIDGVVDFGMIRMDELKGEIIVTLKVVDSVTGEAIPRVTVNVYKYNEHIQMQYSGNKEIIDLTINETGNYKFVLSADGYEDKVIDNVVIDEGVNALGPYTMTSSLTPTHTFSVTHTSNGNTTDILATSPITMYNGVAEQNWTINSSADWTATKSGDWFTIDKTSGKAGETVNFKINITKSTNSQNNGTITFKVEDTEYKVNLVQKASHLKGWIITGASQPVTGAVVTVSNGEKSYNYTTEANGVFDIPVPNAWYTISVTADGYESKSYDHDVQIAGEDVDVGAILLTKSTVASLTATIKDGDEDSTAYGQALADVSLDVYDSTGNRIGNTAKTNENGIVAFEFPVAGTYKLVFSLVGYKTVTVDTVIINENTTSLGTYVMMKAEAVTSISGTTTPGTKLELLDEDGKVLAETIADENGNYDFGDIPGWDGTIFHIRIKDTTLVTEVIGGATGIVIDTTITIFTISVPEKVQIDNKVGAISEWEIESSHVWSVTATGDTSWYTLSSTTGECGITEFTVTANSVTDAYRESVLTFALNNRTFDVTIYQRFDRTVSGNVVDSETGEPIADVDVKLVFTAAKDNEISTLYSTTTKDGTYCFDFFEKGTCSISYSHWGYNTVTVEDIAITADKGNFSTQSLVAKSVIDSGMCGDDIVWVLYDDYTLVVSGTGDMWNYHYDADKLAPWGSCRDKITSIVIGEGITSIGEFTFFYCENAEGTITVPEGVTSIRRCAFEGCRKISSYDLPSTLTDLADNAFRENNQLAYIYIPYGITAIKDRTFERCYNLSYAYLPDTIRRIDYYAFGECYNLTHVDLPQNLEVIERAAFWHASLTGTVNIPAKVSSIGEGAFYGERIQSIVVDQLNMYFKSVDGVLYNYDMTELMQYPRAKPGESFTVPDGVI